MVVIIFKKFNHYVHLRRIHTRSLQHSIVLAGADLVVVAGDLTLVFERLS
jgi:hypothetical protein